MACNIDDLPRAPIGFFPTPLIVLQRLSDLLQGPTILMKRDDLSGLGLGGNKVRKLEFLVGEALSQKCDTLITGGAIQSNHCRQTAAAAAAVGLECHLALGGEEPEMKEGNLFLDSLLGAIIHWCGNLRKGERIPEIAEKLRLQGRNPYIIPYGGSNAVGAVGFVAAVGELKEQLSAQSIHVDHVVFASSSGGTQAGMAVGVGLYGVPMEVVGIGIDKGEAGEAPYEEQLALLANQIAKRLGVESRYTAASFRVRSEYLGEGHGVVGDLEREAIQLVARQEGILLDPVYTGRAMGALIDMIRKRQFSRSDTVLFWHTGGIPALFAYSRDLLP